MIISLTVGQSITPLRHINPSMVRHWKFAKECADIGGGLMPGADLKIVALSKLSAQMWVQVELPGRHPPATIKIAGEEYAHNFKPHR